MDYNERVRCGDRLTQLVIAKKVQDRQASLKVLSEAKLMVQELAGLRTELASEQDEPDWSIHYEITAQFQRPDVGTFQVPIFGGKGLQKNVTLDSFGVVTELYRCDQDSFRCFFIMDVSSYQMEAKQASKKHMNTIVESCTVIPGEGCRMANHAHVLQLGDCMPGLTGLGEHEVGALTSEALDSPILTLRFYRSSSPTRCRSPSA